jgi:hypothetical protein
MRNQRETTYDLTCSAYYLAPGLGSEMRKPIFTLSHRKHLDSTDTDRRYGLDDIFQLCTLIGWYSASCFPACAGPLFRDVQGLEFDRWRGTSYIRRSHKFEQRGKCRQRQNMTLMFKL